jgi:hypothetical protein
MGDIFMSQNEGKIYHYFEQVMKKSITLVQASTYLDIGYRQAKRQWQKYKAFGVSGIVSKKRGTPSNRKISNERKSEIASIISLHYPDFKPTFAKEMLEERHNIFLSKETIRKIMIEHQIWFGNTRKDNPHQRRERRKCFGELVQTDASVHLWFETRGPKCHLYIIIDDATSEIVAAYFEKEETTEGYFKVFELYFNKVGLPVSIYCDKRGVFKVNQQGINNPNPTQFGRAMKELGIKLIFAHSPQAKGRVERAFEMLQDRLIKEMRLENISTIEEANKFLPGFLQKYKLKFAKPSANPFNAHRSLNNVRPLKYILCFKHKRTVSKNLELSFRNEIYQIQIDKSGQNLRRVAIDILETIEGEIYFEYQGKEIKYRKYSEIPYEFPGKESIETSFIMKRNKVSSYDPVNKIQKRESEFSKIVEMRGYLETSETLTKAEKQEIECRLKERKRLSREDNIEILEDKIIKGDSI